MYHSSCQYGTDKILSAQWSSVEHFCNYEIFVRVKKYYIYAHLDLSYIKFCFLKIINILNIHCFLFVGWKCWVLTECVAGESSSGRGARPCWKGCLPATERTWVTGQRLRVRAPVDRLHLTRWQSCEWEALQTFNFWTSPFTFIERIKLSGKRKQRRRPQKEKGHSYS